MANFEIRTYADIQNEILRRGKIATDTTTASSNDLAKIKTFINNRYVNEIAFAKKWNWREQTRLLTTTASYTTGTSNVVKGARQVTLSAATTVTNDFVGRYFKVGGDKEYYEILAVNTTSRTLQLATAYIGTTNTVAAYTVFRNKYGIWPDFQEVYEIRVFGRYDLNPLEAVSTEQMTEMQGKFGPTQVIFPTHYSVGNEQPYFGPPMGSEFLMGYDFMGNPNTLSLVLFPQITNQQALEIKYGRRPIPLNADLDEPIIPMENREVLVFGGLADWFGVQRNETAMTFWEGKYNNYLNKMKAHFDQTISRAKIVAEDKYRKKQPIYPIIYLVPQ